MEKPVCAQKEPFPYDVEAGKAYFWCSCGRSKNQPLCDGSHTGSGFMPVKFEAAMTETVYFCGCKGTYKAPLCDGSHKLL